MMIPNDPKPGPRPAMSTTADAVQPWTEHWARTLSGSIDLQADDPVARALRGWWNSRIGTLRSCPRIVDVGSGPAILPRLMVRLGWTPELPTRWWCVDQAELGTDWQQTLPSAVQVLDRTCFEASLAPEGPVDALVSNFGLEYLPMWALAKALPAWLHPRGHIQAVLHARGSVIDQVSREHAADLELALRGVKLHQHAQELAKAMATAPSDPLQRMMHGVEVRDAYNQAVDQLKQHMDARGRASAVLLDMLHSVTAALRQLPQVGVTQICTSITEQARAYNAEAARLQQMLNSALDEIQARALRDMLVAQQAEGWGLELGRLDCALGQVAWNLSTAT